jgi:hypothetical protein
MINPSLLKLSRILTMSQLKLIACAPLEITDFSGDWITFETITGLWPLAKATQYRQKYFIGGKTNYLM